MIIKKIFLLSLFLSVNLVAQESLDVDNLLDNIHRKTDLSSKTKLENSGVYVIYTRDDINRMQARNLKDILKSTYPFSYDENRYGLSDPYYIGTSHPFNSSIIRVYIDNQEVTNGLYGSGLLIYGDMDIGFVDHIEVYTGSPTYEFSTESAHTVIKLYSKKAQKDEGSKISLGVGSFGSSKINVYTSQELDNDWSYFAFASQDNTNRKKHSELSRDKKTSHIFASFYNDNHRILLDAGVQKKDTFLDQSYDATPIDANMENDFFHLGYDATINNFSYLISYDLLKSRTNFTDDVVPLASMNYMAPASSTHTDSRAYVLNAELKHEYNLKSNNLMLGLKYRYKGFKYDTLIKNDMDLPRTGNTNQQIMTAFIENKYFIEENSIFTAGFSTSRVTNNHSVQDDNLYLYRLGHTYTTENWTFKTIFSHIEYALDPYLINSYNVYITEGKKDVSKQNIYIENIKYKKDNSEYQLTLSYLNMKNALIPEEYTELLYNNPENIGILGTFLSWTYFYNQFDKFYIIGGYEHASKLPIYGEQKQYLINVRNLNTYKKFDIFNELLYSRDTLYEKNFYDYSFGVTYNYTKDFSLSFKAVNIFNKAKTTSYKIVDPETLYEQAPLNISPIDRHIEITLEYLF